METYDLGKLFVNAISTMSRIRFPEVTWLDKKRRSRGHIVSSTGRGKPKPRGIFHSQVLTEMVGQESLPRKNAHRERSLGERAVMTPSLKLKRGMTLGTAYPNMAKKEEIKQVEEFGIWERGASEGTKATETHSQKINRI